MNLKRHLKLPILLVAAALSVTGCAGEQITFSNGNTVQVSELTRDVTWMEDAELLMLQTYAKGLVIANVCDDLDDVEQDGLDYWLTELKAQRDVWLFPNISDTAKQDWQTALQALTKHYTETADDEFCDDSAKELSVLGKSKLVKHDD